MSTRISPVCVAAVRSSSVRIACALVLVVAGALVAGDRPDPPKIVEEIVAKINGDIVTRGDLEKAHAAMEREMKAAGVSGAAAQKQLEQAKQDELKNQIDSFLLVQKGKELDINVDADLNREIAGIQSESKISDPDKFHEFVRQMAGVSFEDWRLKQKNRLITDRVISEEVWRNINIPEAEMQKYYDAHKTEFIRKESVTLRLIMISTGDGKPETVAAAEKKAAGILARARGSADKFSDLARQYSDDPSAGDDGLLPTAFERGAGADPSRELNKAIEDVVFSHDKGYVTDLIQVRGVGFEIFRVEDHIAAGQASFDDVKGQINNILTRPIADPKLRDYLTKLRQNAFLQIKAGYIDTGAAPGKDTSWKDPAQLTPETTTKAAVANQRHLKKILGIIPYGYTGGEKDMGPAAPSPTTPVQQAPPTTNADGTPR
jgi:peptidyl-prolyl cis-trans isomerase SurA